jgi:enamine deaminase RidA (YjgF/YER057c/UK114 family)
MSKQKPVMERMGRGMRVGNLYFFTAIGWGPKGPPQMPPPDWGVDKQIRALLEFAKKSLEEAGSSLQNVVKATVYLVNLDDRERYLNPI